MNKKLTTILALGATVALLAGCGASNNSTKQKSTEKKIEVEHTYYFQSGRYYFNADLQGQVVTEDGNVWGYTQDIISEEPAYHNEPVIVVFDDNGTPDDIYDDPIVGLMLDRETAIYDELEDTLSESFAIERNGNNIRIGTLK